MLLSRNKDFLVFYRGKSFLSPQVAEALVEKERLARTFQDEEEQARLRASSGLVVPRVKANQNLVSTGTLGETLDAASKWGRNLDDDDHVEEVKQEAEKLRSANLVRKLERKLAFVSSCLEPSFPTCQVLFHILSLKDLLRELTGLLRIK